MMLAPANTHTSVVNHDAHLNKVQPWTGAERDTDGASAEEHASTTNTLSSLHDTTHTSGPYPFALASLSQPYRRDRPLKCTVPANVGRAALTCR